VTMQKVGLYIGTQFPPGTDVAVALKDMNEQVRVARQSGFSSLWVPHHYLTHPMQMLAPVPMLSYLLRDAEGMTIGTNILIMPLLHPVHVAEDAVTLEDGDGSAAYASGMKGLAYGRGRRPGLLFAELTVEAQWAADKGGQPPASARSSRGTRSSPETREGRALPTPRGATAWEVLTYGPLSIGWLSGHATRPRAAARRRHRAAST